MQRRHNTYRWLIAVCCWLSVVSAPCSAWAFDKTAEPAALPSYQFQSTSAYAPMVGTSAYSSQVSAPFTGSTPMNSPRRKSPWDENPEGEDEIGVAYKPPVGDTPWIVMALLLMAYVVIKKRKKRCES